MSTKWRSSKMVSVDGTAFKQARLSFKNQDESSMRGEYGHGSQDWLALQAKLSPRTVNELEAGKATLKTVDAVSNTLGIKGREYILGYGADFTSVKASGVVDFRPVINGRDLGNEEVYRDMPFLITLLPVSIRIDDDFIEKIILKNMTIQLFVGDVKIDFVWIYNVLLNSRSSTWLGDEEDVSEVEISKGIPYQESIMFKQRSITSVGWKEFIDHINSTDEKRILLSLTLEFEHFQKNVNILISVEEIKSIFEKSYPKGYPYWVEPNALMP